MEFNTTTFILEIVNFLILIWILQRLFYKPILESIAKRKQYIDQSLNEAKKMRSEAEELRTLYENRQQLWEQEMKAAQTALQLQLDAERVQRLEQLHKELEQERQKALITLNRQNEAWQAETEKRAITNGTRFAGMLLQQAACAEVETRLLTLLLKQLDILPESSKLNTQIADGKKNLAVTIVSAFPLDADIKPQLEQKIQALIDRPLYFQYQLDSTLLAGVRIDIGAWVLQANLAHELTGFAEIAYESD